MDNSFITECNHEEQRDPKSVETNSIQSIDWAILKLWRLMKKFEINLITVKIFQNPTLKLFF